MKSLILAFLGTTVLPSAAFADAGHIADAGHGHSHWFIYLLLASVLFGLAVWARAYLNER
jgi:hypothetical protein